MVAIAIGLWVVPHNWGFPRDATNILLQGVPHGIDLDTAHARILLCGGVVAFHDPHLWPFADNDMDFTAHIGAQPPDAGRKLRRLSLLPFQPR